MSESTGPRPEGDLLPALRLLTRRRVLFSGAGIVAASLVTTAGYAAIEPEGLVVTRYALTPSGWPADRKLSIAVIADLHAGGPDMLLPHVRHVVDTANQLRPDLVVLLGDFIARYKFASIRVEDLLWAAELARLRAPLGTWAILGNHDWWYDLHGVRSALADVRIPVLENDAVLLGAPGQKFWLAALAISSRIRSATAASAVSTTFPGRSPASAPTIPLCCWCMSRTSFPAFRHGSRSRSPATPTAGRSGCR